MSATVGAALKKIAESGTRLIVTVDNGISAVAARRGSPRWKREATSS